MGRIRVSGCLSKESGRFGNSRSDQAMRHFR